MLFFTACGADEDENSGTSGTSVCSYGTYECHGNDSYYCGYPYSSNDLMWLLSERCSNGCDYTSGKCFPNSDDGNNGGSGDNGSSDNNGNSSGSNDAECTSGKFKCIGSESYYCNSLGSWVYDARCENGCDSATGKCKSNSNDDTDSGDSSDSGNNNDHGDTDTGGGSSAIEQCTVGTFTCKTGSSDGEQYSFICREYDFDYHKFETCKSGCDSSTGKCKPWKDPDTNLTWSSLQDYLNNPLDWEKAVSYCENLSEGGYSNWHLPTISELRTLIQNCPATQTGGECGVTDSCLSYSDSDCYNKACFGCDASDSSGKYSKLGDSGAIWFWSSSTMSGNTTDYAWLVYFGIASVDNHGKSNAHVVRCVR